eukprot:m.281782 g.281782  ORF g.281782 m.281782 type:complete len:105 (+) comp22894_c13_seq6:111-425(+)
MSGPKRKHTISPNSLQLLVPLTTTLEVSTVFLTGGFLLSTRSSKLRSTFIVSPIQKYHSRKTTTTSLPPTDVNTQLHQQKKHTHGGSGCLWDKVLAQGGGAMQF